MPLERVEGLHSILCGHDGEAEAGEQASYRISNDGLVFDDEDCGGGRGRVGTYDLGGLGFERGGCRSGGSDGAWVDAGETHTEPTTGAWFGVDHDGPAVGANDAEDHGEPHSSAGEFAREEGIEDLINALGWDTAARVADF